MKILKSKSLLIVILAIFMVATSITIIFTGASAIVFAESDQEFSPASINTNANTKAVLKQESIEDFIQTNQSIVYQSEIYDFEGNKFLLYELNPAGYAIYSVKEDASVFVEGSYSSTSPFYQYINSEIKYLGFGDYYYEQNGMYVNILNGERSLQVDLPQGYELQESAYTDTPEIQFYSNNFPNQPDPNQTVNTNGFVKIKNHSYFENLTQFPNNTLGTCSLVAISIMLGYLDEYVDSRFIANGASYEGKAFKNGVGTTDALHDYLFDHCLHTMLGIESDSGYPMANGEIKATMKDYLRNKCETGFIDKVDCIDGCIFYTHKNPRKHINSGSPTMITMTKYESSVTTDKEKWHTVVAYGYDNNDRFLVHMGWWPGSTSGTKAVISNATIYSYNTFAMK